MADLTPDLVPGLSTVLLASGGDASDARLFTAAVAGIVVLVVLVTVVKIQPLLSLTLGALVVGVVAGENLNDTVESFVTGVGDTVASVGLLIALGAIMGGCWWTPVEPTRSSTRSSGGPPNGPCRGRWPGSAPSSGSRCSSRSGWSC